jgi:DNA-binding MarR family transcriptional regulator
VARCVEAEAFEAEFPGGRWLASRCARELEVVGTLVEGAVGAVCRRHGLSHAALNALAVIEGEGQPMLTGEVATRMHVTSGTITSLLDNLERKGFVARSNDPDDRRRVLVDVTKKAQGVLDAALPEIQVAVATMFERIGVKRQQDLLDLLADVRDGIDSLPDELPAPKARRRPKRLSR